MVYSSAISLRSDLLLDVIRIFGEQHDIQKKLEVPKTGGIKSRKLREDNPMIKRKETPNTTQKTKDWATWTPQ